MSEKRVGIKDVAREAGVSITTVSRALNGYDDVSAETKKKILKVVEKLNYVPDVNARSLGGIAPTVMALLLSGLYEKDDSGSVFALISSMNRVANEHGCEFIILTTDAESQNRTSYVNLCRKRNVDGVLITGLNLDDPYSRELIGSEIPCVVVEGDYTGENTCGISVDNAMASYEAVRYLTDLGHKRIALMNGRASAQPSMHRRRGYEQALINSGIEIDETLIYDGSFLEEEAYRQTELLLKDHPDVTAIFCASDVMAIGVINALEKSGKSVPDDISVVGFDDIPLAGYIGGGLTTVRQSFYDMGIKGAETLYQMIQKEPNAGHIYVPYKFIERNTAAPPRI